MGEPVKFLRGRWRDANGQYAPKPPPGHPLWATVSKPPTVSHLRALPAPPPEPTAAPPPPPPPPPADDSEPATTDAGDELDDGVREPGEEETDTDAGDAAPAEEAEDWAREEGDAGDEPPEPTAEPPQPPQGLSTAEVMAKLNVGALWAGLVRLAAMKMPPALPPGTKPAPLLPGEVEQYTQAWADVADRYFPTIPAGELLVLGLVTIGGVRSARAHAVPPPPAWGEEGEPPAA